MAGAIRVVVRVSLIPASPGPTRAHLLNKSSEPVKNVESKTVWHKIYILDQSRSRWYVCNTEGPIEYSFINDHDHIFKNFAFYVI